MNEYDSGRILDLVRLIGYEKTENQVNNGVEKKED